MDIKEITDDMATFICDHVCEKLKGMPGEDAEDVCNNCRLDGFIMALNKAHEEEINKLKNDLAAEQNKSLIDRVSEAAEHICINFCNRSAECKELLDTNGTIENCPFRKLI